MENQEERLAQNDYLEVLVIPEARIEQEQISAVVNDLENNLHELALREVNPDHYVCENDQ